LRHRATCLLTS